MKQFIKDLGNVSLAPKGKWSREQEYERLALVYNACDNLSYIAKINVPSGVDIENREYWQPMNATGYADNNFINLTAENENGIITAFETLEEAVATILPINRRAGATLSFYNLNSDRLDRQAEFELWQFNSTDLANWENKDYWNNVYYNWNVFVGWYIGADALKNHVKLPNVGQYAYVGSNLNDAILYQCRTNGTWTNTGTKVRNYISVVVSGNITIGDNGNWFSDGKDTGIPAAPVVDEQLDNIAVQLQQHNTEIDKLQGQDVILKSNIDSNFETINNNINTATTKLQSQITSNDTNIDNLNKKHESLSKTVQGIVVTGGASTATNVTYVNNNSGLNAENAQDAIDELQGSKIDKTSILQESGEAEDKVMSQKIVSSKLNDLQVQSIKGEFLIYPYYVLESDPSHVNNTTDGILHVFYFRPNKKKYITNILKKSIWRGVAYLYKGTFTNKTYVKSIMFDSSKDNPVIDLSNELEDFDFVLINYKDSNKEWNDLYRYAQCGSVQDEELSKDKLDKSSVSQDTGDAEDKVISQKVVTNNLLALLSIKGEFLVYPKYVLESDPRRIQPQSDSSLSVLYFKPQKKKYITNIKSNNLIRGVMYLYKGTMSNFTYVKSIMIETKDNLTIDLSNEIEDFDFALINYKDENKKWEDHFRYAQCDSVQDKELSEELLSKIDKTEKWKDFTIQPYFVLESDPSRVLVTTDGILHVFYFNPKKEKYMTNILEKNIYRGLAYLYKGSFEDRVYVKSISFEVKDNPILDFSNETSDFDFVLINYKDENKKWNDSYQYAQYQEEELSKRISNNQWYGKKICIIGTSVAHGSNAETAYGYIAQQRLGFNMIPAGVPGQAIHGKIVSYTESGIDKKILSPLIYGSGALTKAEYAAAKAVKDAGLSTDVIGMAISESPNNPNNWAGEDKTYNNYYRTWENLFTEDNKDVALWIYATIPNNNNYSLDDWNKFDANKWAYKDGTAFENHRTTFLGAMLYLMDKMYSVQPTARMVLVIDSEFNYELGKNNFKLLSETYNIPIIDLWSKINTSPKSLLQLKSFNGTNSHPSTFGHEIMGNIFTNELLLIS